MSEMNYLPPQSLEDALTLVAELKEREALSIDQLYSPMRLALEPGELIVALEIPDTPAGAIERFINFMTRKAIDFATVSVAARHVVEGDLVQDARIVQGGVARALVRRAVSGETN